MATAVYQKQFIPKGSLKPDPGRVRDQLEILQTQWAQLGPPGFAESYCWILRKNPEPGEKDLLANKGKWWNRRLIPFKHNRIQLNLDEEIFHWDVGEKKWRGARIDLKTGKLLVPKSVRRNIMLKPRQAGYTTYFLLMRLLIPTILEPGTTSLLISQNSTYAAMHFAMIKRALRYFAVRDPYDQKSNLWTKELHQHALHEAYSNRHEVIFDQLDSRIICASAEVEEVGQGVCVSPDTLIQKWNGKLIRYKNLSIGDWVVGPDGEKVQIDRKYIIPAQKHPYKGEGRKITLCGVATLPITVAPNHPFKTQRGMVEAQDLKVGRDYLVYPKRKLTESKKYSKFAERDWAPKEAFGAEKKIELNRDFGLLCGMFLADGHVTEKCVAIKMINERKRLYALERLMLIGSKVVVRPHMKSDSLQLNGVAFSEWLQNNFGRAVKKHIPNWWNESPREFLIGLLEGWLTGDGWHCKKRNYIEGYGRNIILVTAMKEIAIALGLGVPYLHRSFIGKGERFICGYPANSNYNFSYSLGFRSVAYENLCRAFGWKVPKIGSQGRKISQYQDDNYVYLKVAKLEMAYCKKWYDITVKNKSHLYCLPYTITHNTLQHVQCTEVARWEGNPEETMSNMKEAIAAEGTLDLESTANGQGGYFFEECMRAMDPKNKLAEFKFHFHEWWWHDEYRRNPKKYRVSEETLTDEEKTIVRKAKLDLSQIAFRREKKIALRHNFDEKYPEDPHTCFLVTGNTYFDRDILRARYLELRPNDQMLWYKPEAKLRKLQVFERRIKGRNYIIGADPASGKATKSGDPDFSAAVVIDQMTGKEMAAYRSRIPPDEFAFDLAELGRAYNDAHIVVERWGDGGVVITTLEIQCQYMNLYKHKDLFKRDRKRVIEMLGFPTTTKTRPLGLGWLKSFLNKFPELIFDVRFLDEAFTFVFNDTGKPEAAEGTHDDTVMCRALAHYVRMVRNGYYDPISGYTAKYDEEAEDEDVEADYAELSEEDVAP